MAIVLVLVVLAGIIGIEIDASLAAERARREAEARAGEEAVAAIEHMRAQLLREEVDPTVRASDAWWDAAAPAGSIPASIARAGSGSRRPRRTALDPWLSDRNWTRPAARDASGPWAPPRRHRDGVLRPDRFPAARTVERHGDGGDGDDARVAGPLPGRAVPSAPADPGVLAVDWTYRLGRSTHHVVTTLAIDGSLADGVRRPVLVSTSDASGQLLVTYPGTAFRDAAGNLHVDARGAPVSGPLADQWSPDSFLVDQYGQVRTADDLVRGGGGWVTGRR